MARMFPAEPIEPVASNAERLLFDLLREQLPNDFTVLHSVKWLSRTGGRDHDGEVDFLIAHPRHGVLVLEVKGGEIARDPRTGKWTSRNRLGELFDIKDPFDQARRSMFNLRDKFQDARFDSALLHCMKRAVVFPDVEAGSYDLGPDAPRSLILDADDLRDISNSLMHAWQPSSTNPIGEAGVTAIVGLLSPAVELRQPRLASIFDREHEEILRLTRDQIRTLDLFANHRRMAVRGVAGSGKSLLAVESMRRLATQGFRVLYTCFNQALADWARESLRAQMSGDLSLIYVDNFHDLAEDFARRAGIALPSPDSLGIDAADYYRSQLPQHFMDALNVLPDRFDAVIVDEGQDFDDVWWLPLEALLADPENGIFYIFYDDNQLLYLDRGNSYPVPWPHIQLQWNCRTTKCINRLAASYGDGLAVDHCLGPDGREADIVPVESQRLADGLRRVVHRLTVDERVALGDIVVLSARAQHRSALADGTKLGNVLLSWRGPGPDRLQITSIHKFKGLQAPVVILVELEHAYPQTRDALIHVGLTRARHHVVVLGELPAPKSAQRGEPNPTANR